MTDQALSQLCDQVRELLPRVTPGEWEADPDERPGMEWNWHIVLAEMPDNRIAFLANSRNSNYNAALIALAPSMAAALLKMREDYERQAARADEFARKQGVAATESMRAEAKLAEIAEIAQSEIGKMQHRWFDVLMQRIHAIATSGKEE